ncbi:helix-turn-helix domain-containing protein [uncultured Caulobacter sp.]|uniref:helix-turn-helix transcriptional regulator n=1 Tax=uncultured Caulobacter sp. TaxID=158749 RepID=UPI00263746FC|nr:helix-turn-helix domain-containing protein [uncultured Caulobacter sp.]
MTSNGAAGPPRHLRTPEAARFLGLSDRTLEKHRSYGTGPVYRKIGGRVVYALADLQAWSERAARTSTSDPNAQVVPPAKRHSATAPAFTTPGPRDDGAGR